MNNLPDELKEFPHDLLKKLRDGTLSSPRQRLALLEQGSGWLYTIGELASKARGGYRMKVVESKAMFAKNYSYKRSTGESVSGSKLFAETHIEYVQYLREEVLAEEEWHQIKSFHENLLEAVNALKVAMKYDLMEGKYLGQ